jgi:hypothetical protein
VLPANRFRRAHRFASTAIRPMASPRFAIDEPAAPSPRAAVHGHPPVRHACRTGGAGPSTRTHSREEQSYASQNI